MKPSENRVGYKRFKPLYDYIFKMKENNGTHKIHKRFTLKPLIEKIKKLTTTPFSLIVLSKLFKIHYLGIPQHQLTLLD